MSFFMLFHCLQPDGDAHKASRHEVSMRTITPNETADCQHECMCKKKSMSLAQACHRGGPVWQWEDQRHQYRVMGCKAPAGLLVLSDHCLLFPALPPARFTLCLLRTFLTQRWEKNESCVLVCMYSPTWSITSPPLSSLQQLVSDITDKKKKKKVK